MNIKTYKKSIFYILLFLIIGCSKNKSQKEIRITNTSNVSRSFETISISVDEFETIIEDNSIEDVLIKNVKGSFLVTQLVDNNLDGVYDELLFQINIEANEEKIYQIVCIENGKSIQPKSEYTTYSRFIPERFDDYAWENNRIAFRTYGPKLQEMYENNISGGGVSSGIDLWLKRVTYPIINDWYSKNLEIESYYHTDRGEGYDPYHVGKSRGAGGIGIWKNDSLITSKNFIAYRTIAPGPIRNIFELDYAPWSEYGVVETKRISLDLNSNFSKFEITLKSKVKVPNYTIGLTLHDRKGEISMDEEKGWFRHWEKIDDSYLGEGIVLVPKQIEKSFSFNTEKSDESHLFIITKPKESLTYYVGFAWLKSGQIKSLEDWDNILEKKSKEISNPLIVSIKE